MRRGRVTLGGMPRLLPMVLFAAGLCGCEMSVYSAAGVSAGIAPAPEVSPMPGWSIQGHAQHAYAAETDTEVTRDGRATVRFHPTSDAGGQYATFMTSLDAAPFRGRRRPTSGETARSRVRRA